MSRYAVTAICANFAKIGDVIRNATQPDAIAKMGRADSGVVLGSAKVQGPISPEGAP